jgi:hypothetical protein
MEKKREVDQEELAAMCLCAPSIALYPSPTFAVHCTSSSQSSLERNRGHTTAVASFLVLFLSLSTALVLIVHVFCLLKNLDLDFWL